MSDQSVQRRLAAVLAADVAGYTRLMESDSDGTVAAWQDAREAVIRPGVAEYSGKIVKLTGDGFLVEFPTVQDAVNCAIALQAGLVDSSLEFRMGVNLGDIIDDGEDIHGEGVNVAARLEGLAEPGGICISGMVYESIRNRIEANFEDMGEQEVKNVSAPVRAYRIRLAGKAEAAFNDAISNRPSIAVLPFDNLSGEQAQEYFSDGISEDIITALSRSRWLRVVARNSSFSYKGQSPDIRTVSQELNARYVLEGSVRKAGDQIRISAQLIDGASGDHIWAERYDRALDDIFAVQDDITETVAAAMEPELAKSEMRRASSKSPANLDAWDLYHRGTTAFYQRDKASVTKSISLLEQSVERDPDFCRAWAGLTESLFLSIVSNFSDNKARDVDRMDQAARNAVRADNDDHVAHEALGRAHLWQKKYRDALAEYEKALELNPVSGRVRYGYGVALLHSGDAANAETEFNVAIQLSPRDPYRSAFYSRMSYCQIALRNYVSAVDWARKSISEPFTEPTVYLILVSALGHLERPAEMKDAMNELFQMIPDASLGYVRALIPSEPETLENFLEGLRKAGLPEGRGAAGDVAADAGKPSIAVLPFDNLSGDAEQEYFSDGMAEDLITDLSKISGLSVAARNSSFSFKGQMPDVRDVAEKLGVKFVLEGSVRKMGERLRINAQLIDAAGGDHVWAERYDGDMADIFDFQDRIRAEIVAALALQLTPADEAQGEKRRTHSVEAYDCYLKGRANYYRYSSDALAVAFEALEKAIALDPEFVDAHSYLSGCYLASYIFRWLEIDEGMVKALGAAETAVELDPGSATAQYRLGWVHTWRADFDKADSCFQKAISLDAGSAEAYLYYGVMKVRLGEPAKALELTNKALEIDPFLPPADYHLGLEYFFLGELDKAIAAIERARAKIPNQTGGRLHLAIAYAEAGRTGEARAEIEAVLKISPDYTVQLVERIYIYNRAEDRERFLSGLRKAGLPESEAGAAVAASGDKPSIAVLPFDNLSGDAEQEYFSDGMAEDLITDLSQISGLAVAARNSSFSFKGQMPDVREVAEKLGVAYILEGSVRKMGERLRINAQLINAADGNHLWAERYDGDMAEIFDFQDRIREEIVTALKLQLTPADTARSERKQTTSVEAYDLYLRGRAEYYKYSPDNLAKAEEYLTAATGVDPDLAEAYAYLSRCIVSRWIQSWPGHDATLERAMETAERAVILDPGSALGFTMLAWVQNFDRKYDQSKANFERAISLDPNIPEVYATYALANSYWGDPEETLVVLGRALAIDTMGHPNANFLTAQCYYLLGRLEEAAGILTDVIAERHGFMPAHVHLAATYVEMDQTEDAAEVVKGALERVPDFTLADAERIYPYKRPEDRERFFGALRKSGLPDGSSKEIPASADLADKPSIAVLPFDNLSGDPEQEYFSDGISEDLITALSRIRQFHVLARNTTFTFKGKSVDVQAIASELDVRYVLEGSVRKSGGRVRITAQLIDGDSGNHLWAERYDRELEDVFEVQDEIVRTVIGAMGTELNRAEQERAAMKPPENLDAWELHHRGMAELYKRTFETNVEARRLFAAAIERDPNFAAPHAGISRTYQTDRILGDMGDTGALAFQYANRAVELDDRDAFTHYALGAAYLFIGEDFDAALRELEEARQINPGDAQVLHMMGRAYLGAGRAEEGLSFLNEAVRLSPSDMMLGIFCTGTAYAYLSMKEYEQAVKWGRDSIRKLPPGFDLWPEKMPFIAALAHFGQKDEAGEILQKFMAARPEISVETLHARQTYVYPDYLEHLLDGLRMVGLPETAEVSRPERPDKPSIAVLPFDNLSGDPEQEYFSDGISEDIITALSRIRQFFVIARNTTFTYKGQAVDVQAIAKDLGVRYVLEGSVRKSGSRVRITAQLIDGDTGNPLWAEKYDRELEDIFAVQDEITLTVVGAIEPALSRAEQDRARRKPPGSLDAWDYYQRGMQYVWRPSKADTEEATRLLNLALEHDPNFCAAHAYLTFQQLKNHVFGYADTETNKKQILAAGKAALAADDQDALAHYAMGNAHLVRGDYSAAIGAYDRAIEINPSFAAAHHERAGAHSLSGRHDEAINSEMTAMRLSPSDPGRWAMMMIVGMTYFRSGNYEAAADWSRRSTQQPNASVSPHIVLIGSLGHLDLADEAAAAIQKYRESFPEHDVESNFSHSPFLRDESDAATMREGLAKAGLKG
jgi:adenylate cyclase